VVFGLSRSHAAVETPSSAERGIAPPGAGCQFQHSTAQRAHTSQRVSKRQAQPTQATQNTSGINLVKAAHNVNTESGSGIVAGTQDEKREGESSPESHQIDILLGQREDLPR